MSQSRFNKSIHRRFNDQSGLTLLELVIVLAILAILATVAVRSLEPIADQSRFDATQKTLEEVERAIYEAYSENGTSRTHSGFLPDIGNLPAAVTTDPSLQLAELYDASLFPTFTITSFDDPDTTAVESIPVAAGWRGPYLRLPTASSSVLDGWGQPLVMLNDTNNPCSDGEIIRSVISFGANGVISPSDTGYSVDQQLPSGPLLESRFAASVPIEIKQADGADPVLNPGETLRVQLYGPVDGLASVIFGEAVNVQASGEYQTTIPNVSPGPRVLRGMVTTGVSPDLVVVRSTAFKQVSVAPGMNAPITLVLPNP